MKRCCSFLIVAPCSLVVLSTSALVFPSGGVGRRAAFGVRPSWVSSPSPSRSSRLLAYEGADTAVDRSSANRRGGNDTSSATPLLSLPAWKQLGEASQPYQSQSLVREPLSSPYNNRDAQWPLESSSLPSALPGPAPLVAGALVALVVSALAGSEAFSPSHMGGDLASWAAGGVHAARDLASHPQESLQAAIDAVRDMGPLGLVYFGLIYAAAEILAVPATPLTLSAGYLFGVGPGTAVVLLAATVAASVAFVVGKTVLRTWVEDRLAENPQFAKLDRAIGREGFKLLLLVRLSPIFPFALSNYLYGASSIDFASYFWGTLLGFAPGTLAYVYAGSVGQALTLGSGADHQPWYVYVGGMAVLAGFLKLATDVATGLVESLDDDQEGGSVPKVL